MKNNEELTFSTQSLCFIDRHAGNCSQSTSHNGHQVTVCSLKSQKKRKNKNRKKNRKNRKKKRKKNGKKKNRKKNRKRTSRGVAREVVAGQGLLISLVDWYHQLGRLVSESAYEWKDPGSNPAADMVDAARNTV
ncbi:hypothetical protein FHG87_016626 [Trinorchestia longiramus]|nr:hypothetical protein FHG87_016626 [Trinorchestia longiramus]